MTKVAVSTGVIDSWDDAKGFGFIQIPGQKQQVFLHISAFTRQSLRPQTGNRVQFHLTKDKQGKWRADKAQLLSGGTIKSSRKINCSSSRFSIAIALSFIVILTISYSLQHIPLWLLLYFISASLVTFFAYGWDKRSARKSRWRVSELKLHLLSVAGGWPGALLAQQWLRHKSAKGRFKFILWLTISINLALIYLVHRPELNTLLS
ncbi:cold shock and DUF1294 domain-containing protein [Shewanella schlegeliana]|uniref:Cold shock and DUF1294 domain-containing protein n=1 Tax=Shewanella schlegeliana TaxID=190308 RepID=A0ABS1SUQ8_9GAMM|nr:cold shock and DUF1294 domain-containing protein [Shewanella schlegeliana]MBL4912286.1 cold shock and DUF1294 domain-containing protein [Shewanella schlegeliana]MCL1108245.1 cold shock and DUF1294 domain-containing protein [Shewanella schlegeliana]GIU22328.1 DNA-binding protein [Shewanella schlegeliana]